MSEHQISPKLFVLRAFFLLMILSIVQLFHLTVISEFHSGNLVIWLLVVTAGVFYLSLIYFRLGSSVNWPSFNWDMFRILFLTSFFVTLLFSRLPYLLSFLEKGMYLSRLDSNLGSGGWYSYLSILFYPLCIILAFVNIPRRTYYRYFSLMIVVVALDLVVLGTRGAPFFVLLFHLLMLRLKFYSVKSIVLVGGLALLLILLFNYQTQARSLNTFTIGWDWVRTVQYSWIFDNLRVKDAVIGFVDGTAPGLFPLVYIFQYLSHSVAEFRSLLFGMEYGLTGPALYLQDEICLVAGCSRSDIHESISIMNPRAGLYQTLYSSIIFDFGVLGAAILAIALLLYFLVARARSIFIALSVFFAIIIAVSGIENYLYNGLGLARFVVFILLWKIMCTKVTLR